MLVNRKRLRISGQPCSHSEGSLAERFASAEGAKSYVLTETLFGGGFASRDGLGRRLKTIQRSTRYEFRTNENRAPGRAHDSL